MACDLDEMVRPGLRLKGQETRTGLRGEITIRYWN